MQRQRVQHTTLSGPSMILDFFLFISLGLLLLLAVHDFVNQLKQQWQVRTPASPPSAVWWWTCSAKAGHHPSYSGRKEASVDLFFFGETRNSLLQPREDGVSASRPVFHRRGEAKRENKRSSSFRFFGRHQRTRRLSNTATFAVVLLGPFLYFYFFFVREERRLNSNVGKHWQ